MEDHPGGSFVWSPRPLDDSLGVPLPRHDLIHSKQLEANPPFSKRDRVARDAVGFRLLIPRPMVPPAFAPSGFSALPFGATMQKILEHLHE